MTVRTIFAVLAVLAVAFGVAACGGDDEGDKGLPKAELATKADAICKKAVAAARLLQVPPDFAQPNSDSVAAAEYLAKLAPITRKEADDLAALTPAAEVESEWNAFASKQKQLADYLDKVLAKARANDPSALTDLQKDVPRLGQEFTTAAGVVGARGCASGA
jgi:acyl-CoA reductase-like NAD-dependent aldehyde dehydrogenase